MSANFAAATRIGALVTLSASMEVKSTVSEAFLDLFFGGCFTDSSAFFLGLPGLRFSSALPSFFPFALSLGFLLEPGLDFFSGFAGVAGIIPAAISFCSCSYAAAASSPSFWAWRVASSPYRIRCAQASRNSLRKLKREVTSFHLPR